MSSFKPELSDESSRSDPEDESVAGNTFVGCDELPGALLLETLECPVLFCTYDSPLRRSIVVETNDPARSYLGYSAEVIHRMSIGELLGLEELTDQQLLRLRERKSVTLESSCTHSSGKSLPAEATLSLRPSAESAILCVVLRDIRERLNLEARYERRTRQQETLARLARLAVQDQDTAALLENMAREAALTLGASHAAILTPARGGELRLTAGAGWPAAAAGSSLAVDPETDIGYMLSTNTPVRVDTFREDDHVRRSHLCRNEEVQSCIGVSVGGADDPSGVLLIASTKPGRFEACDAEFVRDLSELIAEVLAQDTTKQAVRKSETKYRRLFKESRDALFIVAPDGEILAANPAAEEMFGYEDWHVRAQDLYVNPAQRLEFRRQIEDEGSIRDFAVQMVHRDGTTMDCIMTSTARWNANGEVEAYQTIIRDITAQKAAEEALRASEEKFRTFTEKALVGVYIIQDGVFKYVNPRFAEIMDYTPEDIIGTMSPLELVHPEDRALVSHHITQRLDGVKGTANYTFRALTSSGEAINLEVYGTVIQHDGKPAILGTTIDITERRRLQRQILQVSEEVRRRIGQDLHDGLGQMLTGIGMMAQNLSQTLSEKDSEAAPMAQEISGLINEADRHAHELAHGLTPVDLGTGGLPAALEQLSSRTRQLFDVACEVKCNDTVPIDDTTVATNLYRIAQEAITNAVKHGNAERIEVQLQPGGEQIELTVRDYGEGLDQGASDAESRGMGIDLMKYRARIIGGNLEIRRSSDGGTILTCGVRGSKPVNCAGA